ncbi:hypothetical protein SAMN04488516_102355 [Desulfonauticus submarinus]|uniref:Uncharacterized protein n=1 Tax=Desulfonauticus submarinus TaxID=206665 RepID=A0A1H0C0D5_9BACT|nr:hypothetical protein [Desulfonauticus submarinus]SDN51250.1 hypothetical protein SAMN04488516_102355 [Desulfonauticus submarinus]
MKIYKIIENGRDVYRCLPMPQELYELEITIKPIKKRGSIFSEFLKDKIEVSEYKKSSREEINAR